MGYHFEVFWKKFTAELGLQANFRHGHCVTTKYIGGEACWIWTPKFKKCLTFHLSTVNSPGSNWREKRLFLLTVHKIQTLNRHIVFGVHIRHFVIMQLSGLKFTWRNSLCARVINQKASRWKQNTAKPNVLYYMTYMQP